MTFDIKDFGGIGDGRSLETHAIQETVDQCHKQGGGTVVLSSGVFLSGTITLRDNVSFCIDSTATLVGSPDLSHYHVPADLEMSVVQQSKFGLLIANRSRRIRVSGSGTIDGSGSNFDVKGTIGKRPNLITFIDCEDIELSDLNLKNSALFACLLVACRKVYVHAIRIESRVRPNNDGIDLSSCEDVIVSDCAIRTSDDAIALKSDTDRICRNITITNCLLSSRWAGIRIGPESLSGFENIAVSNCVIHDTFGCGIKLQMAEGAIMQNIVFSNLVMKNVTGPISIRLSDWENVERPHAPTSAGQLKNVLINNVIATVAADAIGHPFAEHTFQGQSGLDPETNAEDGWVVTEPGWTAEGEKRSCISICGSPRAKIEDVTLSNLQITFAGGGTQEEADRVDLPEREHDYPEYYMFGILPAYGLYARHVRDLHLTNVRFDLELQDFRPAIVADDVAGLQITGLHASPKENARSVIRLLRSGQTIVEHCNIHSSSAVFVSLDASTKRKDVHLNGNTVRRVPRNRMVTKVHS